MWTRLRLRNFKAYEDTGDIDLTPLTILIGPNSGGKSSILKALLALRQTAECRDPSVPLHTDGAYCSLGEYTDFAYRGDRKRAVGFDLGWKMPEVPRYTFRRRIVAGEKTQQYPALPTSFSVSWAFKSARLVVQRLSYGLPDGTVLIALERTSGGAYAPSSGVFTRGWKPAKLREYSPDRFYQFPVSLVARAVAREDESGWHIWSRVQESVAALDQQIRSTWYLGPLRYDPLRTYQVSAERPSDVGLKGERAADAFRVAKREARASTQSLTEWVQKIGLADDVDLERLKASFHSLIVADKLGHRANIVDTGFGVSQVFPILMESFYAPANSTILLEQPEIHLNPSVQAGLGDVFVSLVRIARKQFIIETHSEHLISRIRTAIARGDVSVDDVSVYYCSLGESGGTVKRLPVTNLGEFTEWPSGFFEDEVKEAMARTQAVFERQGGGSQ